MHGGGLRGYEFKFTKYQVMYYQVLLVTSMNESYICSSRLQG
jgi:hypothetical protein